MLWTLTFTVCEAHKVHASHLLSVTPTAQSFSWFTCFLYLCTKNGAAYFLTFWNVKCVTSFVRHLKTNYFQLAYPAP